MSLSGAIVRDSTPADLADITAIYAWHVVNGTGTFEMSAPLEADMTKRRDDVLANGLPWLVAEQGGRVLGYAYANRFRPRPAYRFFVEDSVYVAHDAAGMGVGRQLLAALVAQCESCGARQMVAVIGDSANEASIGLHRSLGFEHAGVLKSSGRKFDRWLDVVLMQRALGSGDTTAPEEPVDTAKSQ